MTIGTEELSTLSNAIRGLAVETAGHWHPGASLGMADFATVLYAKHLYEQFGLTPENNAATAKAHLAAS